MLKNCIFTVFSTGSFCQVYRVTDEALIAEIAVWPNFFLMNIFFALKGSKLFNIQISSGVVWQSRGLTLQIVSVESLSCFYIV